MAVPSLVRNPSLSRSLTINITKSHHHTAVWLAVPLPRPSHDRAHTQYAFFSNLERKTIGSFTASLMEIMSCSTIRENSRIPFLLREPFRQPSLLTGRPFTCYRHKAQKACIRVHDTPLWEVKDQTQPSHSLMLLCKHE